MLNKKVFQKIGPIIRQNKWLRIILLLNGVLIILIVLFTFFIRSYNQQTEENNRLILENQKKLAQLQQLAAAEAPASPADNLQNKSLVDFNQVIPFIAFLEKLFAAVDKEAQVSIKTREDQIFSSRFADYRVIARAHNPTALFTALDQLQQSVFITHLIDFNLTYESAGESSLSHRLNKVDLLIRLFLK